MREKIQVIALEVIADAAQRVGIINVPQPRRRPAYCRPEPLCPLKPALKQLLPLPDKRRQLLSQQPLLRDMRLLRHDGDGITQRRQQLPRRLHSDGSALTLGVFPRLPCKQSDKARVKCLRPLHGEGRGLRKLIQNISSAMRARASAVSPARYSADPWARPLKTLTISSISSSSVSLSRVSFLK